MTTMAPMKNFTVRLSEADHVRLQGLMSQWQTDKAGGIRRLIRLALFNVLVTGDESCFTPIRDTRYGQQFPVRLRRKEDHLGT